MNTNIYHTENAYIRLLATARGVNLICSICLTYRSKSDALYNDLRIKRNQFARSASHDAGGKLGIIIDCYGKWGWLMWPNIKNKLYLLWYSRDIYLIIEGKDFFLFFSTQTIITVHFIYISSIKWLQPICKLWFIYIPTTYFGWLWN